MGYNMKEYGFQKLTYGIHETGQRETSFGIILFCL